MGEAAGRLVHRFVLPTAEGARKLHVVVKLECLVPAPHVCIAWWVEITWSHVCGLAGSALPGGVMLSFVYSLSSVLSQIPGHVKIQRMVNEQMPLNTLKGTISESQSCRERQECLVLGYDA